MGVKSAPELITLTEAAKRLNISRVTMSKRVRDGQFTVYTNPSDQREKLLDSSEVEESARPKVIQTRRLEVVIPEA